jgi:hypothetical protein
MLRVSRLKAAVAAVVVVGGLASFQAVAQRVATGAVEAWVDGLLAEARAAGATSASRGAVTVDTATWAFRVADLSFGVTLPTGPGTVTIAAVEGAGVSAGERLRADRLAVSGVVFSSGPLGGGVESLAVEGLDMPPLAPGALLGRGSGVSFGEALAGMTFQRLAAPSMTVRRAAGQNEPFELVWRGLVIDGMSRGVARRVASEATSFTTQEREIGRLTASFGETSAENVDFGLHAELFAPRAGGAREPRLAYTRAVLSGGEMSTDQGFTATLGRIEVLNARLRPPRTGYLELFRRMQDAEGRGQGGSPDNMREFAEAMSDWLDVSLIEQVRMARTSFNWTGGSFVYEGLEARDLASTRYGRIAADGLALTTGDASFEATSLAISDVDYDAMFRALFAEMAAGRSTPDPTAFEGRLPRIGGIEIRDASLDSEGNDTISLESAAFAMGRWRGFVPDMLRLSVQELSVPSSLLEGVAAPRPQDLNYESLDFGADIQFTLDERARTARLSPGRVAITDLGALSIEATLGDVDSGRLGLAGFAEPAALMQQTTFRELRLRVENAGFIDRYTEWAAPREGRPASALRAEALAMLAPIIEMIVTDPAAKEQARAAVQAFARDPRSLTVVITPRGRISLADIAAATQGGGPPLALLPRLDLRVSAND